MSTPYWMMCDTEEVVVDGNLTPLPPAGNARTMEIDVPGPVAPRVSTTRVGTFTLEMDYYSEHYCPLRLYGIDEVILWVCSREEVTDAVFTISFKEGGYEFASLETEARDLDSTPTKVSVPDPPSFSEPIVFDSYYSTLEVEIQYTAASRYGTGPAPGCFLLTGSDEYPSRVELDVVPMDFYVDMTLIEDEKAYVVSAFEDSTTLDPEDDLEFKLTIHSPSGEPVNPLAIEFEDSFYFWGDLWFVWSWSYNLTRNADGQYYMQLDVSYGAPGIWYSNSSYEYMEFDENGRAHLDYDGDGYADHRDAFPYDPDEWCDTDGDGHGDNGDAFPHDETEWKDTDRDGHGDNCDCFPLDDSEWCDTDGDGHGDNCDEFPGNPMEWRDTDNDGYGDNSDAFPGDSNEWFDSDGDGVGDNGDPFPHDGTEWMDTDEDGHGDNSDAFPLDAAEWVDSDGDGHGDNGDAFPDNATEWADTDEDGRGDNSDAFPLDAAEWVDTDDDGHGDNGDTFPEDVAEWADTDEDGHGDNSDAFPGDPAASTDTDGDGHPDAWNTGMTSRDSITGLTLDQYPDDPERWEEEPAIPGVEFLPVETTTVCIAFIVVVLACAGAYLLVRSRRGE